MELDNSLRDTVPCMKELGELFRTTGSLRQTADLGHVPGDYLTKEEVIPLLLVRAGA